MAVVLMSCSGEDRDVGLPSETHSSVDSAESLGADLPLVRDADERIMGAIVVKNGDPTPGLPVRYESMDGARLDELKSRENLDAVVAAGGDEFEQILLLKEWVAAQWPHSLPNPYPPWDALVILDWIRAGKTGGFCGQYAQVLVQSLTALGFSGRYVEVGWVANPYAHFVAEVWSNQFNKWVMLDADYNVHFEREGVPMSALEIHDALVRSELTNVEVVQGAVRDGHPDPSAWPLETAELYYYVRLHLKADHLANPDEPPFDRYNDMVEWFDDRTVPWELSDVQSPWRKEALTNIGTDDEAEFDHLLNQVGVRVQSIKGRSLLLTLEHNVINFARYEVREEAGSEWRTHHGTTYAWTPTAMNETLEVRGVNIRGVPGPTSVVRAMLAR